MRYAAYRTDQGKPWVLPVVRTAEKALANDDSLNKEYLPVLGMDLFSSLSSKMLLGSDSPAITENRVSFISIYHKLLFIAFVQAFGVQTLSGTGALRVGAEFLAKKLGKTIFYFSKPTWGKLSYISYTITK